MLTSVVRFVHYTFFDNLTTRKNLVSACGVMAISNLWLLVVFIAAAISIDLIPPHILAGLAPSYVIASLLWVYYRYICQQWVLMGDITD